MNWTQLLLVKLAEECAEVSKRALKASQFGLDEAQPGDYATNAQRLQGEIDDFMAAVDMLNEAGLGYERNSARIEEKIRRVKYYAKYSERLGMVDCNAICPMCEKIKSGHGPSHDGSKLCESGSIASGGTRAHCTCDVCF